MIGIGQIQYLDLKLDAGIIPEIIQWLISNKGLFPNILQSLITVQIFIFNN